MNMRLADFTLLFKKIAVGVLIAAIPLFIIIGGLSLTRRLLAHSQVPNITADSHPQQ